MERICVCCFFESRLRNPVFRGPRYEHHLRRVNPLSRDMLRSTKLKHWHDLIYFCQLHTTFTYIYIYGCIPIPYPSDYPHLNTLRSENYSSHLPVCTADRVLERCGRIEVQSLEVVRFLICNLLSNYGPGPINVMNLDWHGVRRALS
jgi:hypothetical protein